MKIIEVIADAGHVDTIRGIAEQYEVVDAWYGVADEQGRIASRLLVPAADLQTLLDALQNLLGAVDNARIVVIPVEACIPQPVSDDEETKRRRSATVTREALYRQVELGTQLDVTFLLLVVLSGIVATIGMLENNVAVIIGAMVIAPLLGPNIAFSLGTSLGDSRLIVAALKALVVGIALAVLTGAVIGQLWDGNLTSEEVLLRTDAFNSGTAIALASGAAASLSLVTSVPSVLVGVMVAVALMPPAVTIGLMLSTLDWHHAAGASLLLAVNIVCINLSSKLVFLLRGMRPRTWLAAQKARQSQWLYIVMWLVLLGLLLATISLKHTQA
jgi:uncharacterized hydrophobic protein (TIGR00341 family)